MSLAPSSPSCARLSLWDTAPTTRSPTSKPLESSWKASLRHANDSAPASSNRQSSGPMSLVAANLSIHRLATAHHPIARDVRLKIRIGLYREATAKMVDAAHRPRPAQPPQRAT